MLVYCARADSAPRVGHIEPTHTAAMNPTRTIITQASLLLLLVIPGEKTSRLFGNDEADGGCCFPLAAPLVPMPPCTIGCEPLCIPAVQVEQAEPPTPVVKLHVRVPAFSAPGQPLEYLIRVENCSAADAHHVVVKNALPANAKLVRASPEPHVKEPVLEWRLGTMKAGSGCDITLILAPTNKEDVKNCTRVTFEHGQCVTTRQAAAPASGEPPPGVGPGEPKPPPMPGAEEALLSLTIDGPKKQYANLATRYFVTAKNIGRAAATNLLVDFTPSDKTDFVNASDDGKFLAGKVAWLLGNLDAGASRSVVVTVQPKASGELCHQATALADKNVKAQARFCTYFSGISAINIELKDRSDPIEIGTKTSYHITLINQGTAPLTNIRVRAVIPDGLALTQARGPADNRLGEPAPGGQVLVYDVLPSLAEGDRKTYEVFVQGMKPGDFRFRVQMSADQLEAGPVLEEESTRVYVQNGVPAKPLSRAKSSPAAYAP